MNNEKNYTDEEFQKAFQQILKFYKSRYSSQENPKAFLLGGQPGAGKSALENMINIENKYVSISGDDYRKFHPLYDKLNKIYGKDASKYTQKWSGEMVEHLLKEARKEKWNVILEGTLRKAELPIREAKDFKENGYSVELYVVAVKPEKSYLAYVCLSNSSKVQQRLLLTTIILPAITVAIEKIKRLEVDDSKEWYKSLGELLKKIDYNIEDLQEESSMMVAQQLLDFPLESSLYEYYKFEEMKNE